MMGGPVDAYTAAADGRFSHNHGRPACEPRPVCGLRIPLGEEVASIRTLRPLHRTGTKNGSTHDAHP